MALVSIQDVHKSFAERHLLRGVSFSVADGDRIALVGPNGCGKSTLLRIVAGLLEADEGTRIARKGATIGYLEQEPVLDPARSVLDVVSGGAGGGSMQSKSSGGRLIVMASRALVRVARSRDDYLRAYGHVLAQCEHKVILHWLGEMFDPALDGYWGTRNFDQALATCLQVIGENVDKVERHHSLLAKQKEIDMRRRLPKGVRMYTGDDYNFAELIDGDSQGHSDALLGIFDSNAPAASAALSALAQGDRKAFHDVLAPTVPLSRHIFGAPTRFYKTGVVFLAWLNGHQDHFVMVGGQQSARHIGQRFFSGCAEWLGSGRIWNYCTYC